MLTNQPTINLSGAWHLYQYFGDDLPDADSPHWDVNVPGEVHQQLVDAGVCPDPFVECNFIEQIPWESRHYWYATEFDRPTPWAENVWLVFEGVDSVCEVFLNGIKLGRFDGMFGGPEFDITPHLAEKNRLLVHILPAETDPDTALTFYRNHIPYDGDLDLSHRHLKPPHLMGGYGFPQRVVTAGIWLPVRLIHRNPTSLSDLWVQTIDIRSDQATIRIHIEAPVPDGRADLIGTLHCPQGVTHLIDQHVDFYGGRATFELSLENPDLWWPNGHGQQPLYRLEAQLDQSDKPLIRRFGIRKIRWVTNPGTDKQLTLEVNGQRIYARGVNWPSGDRTLRLNAERCDWLLTLAREANVCLIRYWGGLARDPLNFYERCDELGLLIIQDFPLPNTINIPETESHVDHAIFRLQVRKIVRDLRGYTSVVGWFSGNELRGGEIIGTSLYDLIREPEAILQEEDPDADRPWWPSSYLLDAGFTDEYEHFGRRASQLDQLDLALETEPKFSIEMHHGSHLGLHVYSLRQVGRFLPDAIQTWPPPKHIHLLRINGFAGNQAFMPGSFPILTDPLTAAPYRSWEELSYYSDVYCGFAVEALLGNYRARMPYNSGACPWCWNDQHPMLGAGAVDFYGAPKSLYYSMKRAYSPLRAVMRYSRPERDIRERLRGWVRLINGTSKPAEGYRAHVRVFDEDLREIIHIHPDGTQIRLGVHKPEQVDEQLKLAVHTATNPVPGGSVLELFDFNGMGYLFPLQTMLGWSDCADDCGYAQPPARHFFSVLITLVDANGDVIDHTYYPFNFDWRDSPAVQSITRTRVEVRFDGWEDSGRGRVTIRNIGNRIAPWVVLEAVELELDQYVLSDNYLALLPGEQRPLDLLLRPGVNRPDILNFNVRGFNLA